jgi:hypothetical protein
VARAFVAACGEADSFPDDPNMNGPKSIRWAPCLRTTLWGSDSNRGSVFRAGDETEESDYSSRHARAASSDQARSGCGRGGGQPGADDGYLRRGDRVQRRCGEVTTSVDAVCSGPSRLHYTTPGSDEYNDMLLLQSAILKNASTVYGLSLLRWATMLKPSMARCRCPSW